MGTQSLDQALSDIESALEETDNADARYHLRTAAQRLEIVRESAK